MRDSFPPPPSDADTTLPVSLREYWTSGARERDGMTLSRLADATGVPRSSLYRHLVEGHGISNKNAAKVAEWSRGRISAAKTVGLET